MEPKESFDAKIKFLNEAERKLREISIRIQDAIWKKILPLIELFDERIEPDDATVKQIARIENEAVRQYREETAKITNQVEKDFGKINRLNDQYFKNYSVANPEGFLSGKSYSEALLLERLGIAPNGLVVDGFLNAFKQSPEVLNNIRGATFTALTARTSREALKNRLDRVILGTDTQTGISESQVNRFINDAYNNFDSMTQQARADRLGLRVAIYANTIIQDSRCFCRNRFNRAWTVEEIGSWTASTKSSLTKSGKNCKAIYETTLYDPFVHRGGYNCRHVYRYVPKTTAIRFRPELASYYAALEADGVKFF